MIKNIQSILNKDEKILHDSRVHWIVFWKPAIIAVIGIAAGVFFHPLVGGLIFFMDLYPVYIATAFYITTHLILTEQKVLGRTGFLIRDWIQINLDRIETAYLEEPIVGRWLGYSSVVVRGMGMGAIAFPYLLKGGDFVKSLERLLAEKKEIPVRLVNPPSSASLTDRG